MAKKKRRKKRATTLRWVRRYAELLPRSEWPDVPRGTRGFYALATEEAGTGKYRTVYVGISRTGMRGRLRTHDKNKKEWTHFTVFEVWPNVRDDEIIEIEGLFRHLYRKDPNTNLLNKARKYAALRRTRDQKVKAWLTRPLTDREHLERADEVEGRK